MENIKLVPQLSGLTEYFIPIPGYEGLYEVSNFGRVKSYRRYPEGKLLTGGVSNRGYPIISLSTRAFNVHRLVMLAFVGEANGLEVDHINRVKTDNRLNNLQYLSSEEHRFKDKETKVGGLKGSKHYSAKLTEKEVLTIYQLAHSNSKQSASSIAEQFNVSRETVARIKLGRAWQHITGHKKPA